MADVPRDVLRDTLFIWLYCTVTSYDAIKGGKSADAVQQELEQGNYIKVGDPTNTQTIVEVVRDVKANPEFSPVRKALKGLTVLGLWVGGGPHPDFAELASTFIPLGR